MHANVSPKPAITVDHTHIHHPGGTSHDEICSKFHGHKQKGTRSPTEFPLLNPCDQYEC